MHAGAERSQGERQGVRPVRRLEHRAQGDRPRELARKPQELGIPPRGARLAHRDFRRGRLGGRVPQSRSKAAAVHLVVESWPGLEEERRLAHRLPYRDAGNRRQGEEGAYLQDETLLRSRAVDDRLRREALMSTSYLEVFRSPRLAVILPLGFSSALPLPLPPPPLQPWITVHSPALSPTQTFT